MLRLSKRLALLLAICVPFVFLSLLSLYHLANGSDSEHTINLPFNQPLRGNVPVNIRKPEAKQIGQSARDDSTLYRPDGCPVPRNHSGLDWKYYSALPEHNFKLASRALELTDKPIIHEKQGNGNGVSIPRRLIFTHYVNLIDCDIWRSANVTLSPQLYNLQQNVHHTINAYKTVWGDDLEVVFLKDNDCVEAIKMIESGLVGWFHALDGKLDFFPHLCIYCNISLKQPSYLQECIRLIYVGQHIFISTEAITLMLIYLVCFWFESSAVNAKH